MNNKWANTNFHVPVLKDIVISNLCVKPNGIYLDGTLGFGGHTKLIMKQFTNQGGKILGFDGDIDAIKFCKINLSSSCIIINDSYSSFQKYLPEFGENKFDGMLLDLGISSYQIDNPKKGFSYQNDGPLDMRFNINQKNTANEILNNWNEEDLINLLKRYGEILKPRNIVRAIIQERKKTKLVSTLQVKKIILKIIGNYKSNKVLSKIFQAIRIEVNKELKCLEFFLNHFIDYLKDEGRIVIISYHSLEDRLVKNFFKKYEKGCICPANFPKCMCGIKPSLKLINSKVIVPDQNELNTNSRAKSAKLRVAEKI
ncbi:MAG: 16S rRNA (cytosine(1402)-N(4))-methyltransferase [Candidatus Marinimicrobia bacterium]|nr:16S rRNA (cytosine(1402)-N(4))-methyltransferase [Candidatus Neomarinimicrobiota bacterium]OUW50602.1 MAG: 16S rRNA (cytosine(1402)-N(4))-methyltransferase [bacterium TMED190]